MRFFIFHFSARSCLVIEPETNKQCCPFPPLELDHELIVISDDESSEDDSSSFIKWQEREKLKDEMLAELKRKKEKMFPLNTKRRANSINEYYETIKKALQDDFL